MDASQQGTPSLCASTWQLATGNMRECHDSRWAGHPGIQRTAALVEDAYFWPRMRDDIEAYVKSCLVCQQDKVEHQTSYRAIGAAAHSGEALGECFHGLHCGTSSIRRQRMYFGRGGPILQPVRDCHGTATDYPQQGGYQLQRSKPSSLQVCKELGKATRGSQSLSLQGSQRMKKWADKKRRPREFQDGDLVLVKLYQHGKGSAGQHRGLLRSLLKPFVEDHEDPERAISSRALVGVRIHTQGVEEIVSDRVVHHGHKAPTMELLVKWKGYPTAKLVGNHWMTYGNSRIKLPHTIAERRGHR
ncbi:hypothetical protein GH714_036638 [Hevea brasiliensis]|uniref:Chromo domain-containing protein n=1 Tax=Hevea brasiliensis TaxID=3981 RepID=A0A6A6NKI7_HEVBR|nr:hypothetical protein GH714_036638 [Hevea brasiliensis]